MKKIVLFIIVGLLAFGGFKLIKQKKDEAANEKKAFVHVYKPLEFKDEEKSNSFEVFSAKLEAEQNPKISTKISGHITNIFVKQNQEIKKGDILVSIDDLEYKENISQINYSIMALKSVIDSFELSLNSLKLDMNLSQKEYQTNSKIYKIGGISKDKLDYSQIIYEQKKAKYNSTLKTIESKKNELNSQLAILKAKEKLKNYYTLSSPINGFIEDVFIDIGDLSSVNKPVVSIVSKMQKLSFLFATNTIKKNQEVFMKGKKIGLIDEISVSSKNYMKEAIIKLDKKLEYPNNSLISIRVKIK